MKNNILPIVLITVTLILVFRDKVKVAIALRTRLHVSHIPYAILVAFALFLIFTVSPPWSILPLLLTAYTIAWKSFIDRHRLLHILGSGALLVAGVALAAGAVKLNDIKNEVFLFGHYINLTYEVGPTLFLAAVPLIFSNMWTLSSKWLGN